LASNRSNGEAFAKQQYVSFVAVAGMLGVDLKFF
jgi:hypothetical protein